MLRFNDDLVLDGLGNMQYTHNCEEFLGRVAREIAVLSRYSLVAQTSARHLDRNMIATIGKITQAVLASAPSSRHPPSTGGRGCSC
jgi:hypothetical protein